ncbi:hypothetical protein LZ32DRAFT_240138 [Colletotrichum eremochloae]|nr:hypothetical protein LZ32DRAFT_240138 [Colletotrichum eremochloae]
MSPDLPMFVAPLLSLICLLPSHPPLLNTFHRYRNSPVDRAIRKRTHSSQSLPLPRTTATTCPKQHHPLLGSANTPLLPRAEWHRRSYFPEEQAKTLGTGGDANEGWGPQHHLDA